MSSFSTPRDPFRRGFPRGTGRGRALLPTIVVLVVLVVLFLIFTNFWTDRLWFQAIDYSSVFTKTLLTRVLLFAVFGVVLGAAVFGNLAIAYRLRPRYRAMSNEQQTLDRYRDAIDPHRKLIAGILAGILALIAGSSAAGRWETFLQWQNATAFGQKDPQFGLDVSFYIFDYPWYRFLINFGFAVVVLSLVVALVAHYLYGGIRLQTPGQKVSNAAQGHLSVLLGLFVLLKGVAYWFDRYALMLGSHRLSRQEFTGITYTDANALLPAKTILTIIAVICALLFFANVVRKTWILPGIGFGLLVLSAVLLGWLWPAIVQQFTVRPNEPDREAMYIERNINATRQAYDVADASVDIYSAKTTATAGQLESDAETLPGIRLMDPTIVTPTFEQLQQQRGFYSFQAPLDVDRYTIDGKKQDTVVAVRELSLAGVGEAQRNWNNDHTVYTHGYGFVAAKGNQRDSEGAPVWAEGGLPPSGDLSDEEKYEPRVYFGEESTHYSIVGGSKGTTPYEVDIPGGDGADAQTNYTYAGSGGVPVGSFVNRALYAAKFQDGNILLSGRIHPDSKILYDRTPRERLQKVAPWLTIDSDPYPAIVDPDGSGKEGARIVWILDGYTMTDKYPLSQRLELDDATSDALTAQPAIVGQPSEQVNYIRNSVKAVVDSFDGSVHLYAWDETDPMLRTWMKAFPGTVEPKADMPDELLDHVRYPEDLMKVQREVLGQYHVQNPRTFYGGTERWRVPADPTKADGQRKQPAYYLSVRMPDEDEPSFSLTSTYIYLNRQNLAAFVAVNADARSDNYGKISILQLPENVRIDGPAQISNKLQTDPAVARELLPLRQNQLTISHGNLLTLPVGGGLLYVQPIYVQRKGEGTYPVLQLVVASFGGKIGVGNTLQAALDQLFSGDAGGDTGEEPGGEQPPPTGENPPPTGTPSAEVQKALNEANAAFAAADAALKRGDLQGYAKSVDEAKAAVARAVAAQQKEDATPSPTGTPRPSGSPSPSPSPTPATG